MDRIWMPRSVIHVVDTAGSRPLNFPQLQDLAVREDASFPEVWLAAREGTLWRHGGGAFPPSVGGQEPSPGAISRVAVALDDTVWTIVNGALWARRKDGSWVQVPPTPDNRPLVDVAVHKGAVWVAAADGRVWRTTDGRTFEFQASIISFKRLAGLNHGELWGIASGGTDGWLWHLREDGVWFDAQGGKDKSWVDLSVSVEGTVWLVAGDGTVWPRPTAGSRRSPGRDSAASRLHATKRSGP